MTASVYAQFTQHTIKEIQQVPADSLKYVDSVGYVISAAWTKQASPLNGQKVQVVGLVTVAPYEITFNGGGRTLVLSDTGAAASQPWTSVLVLYGADNTATYAGGKWTGGTFDANGYNSIKRGDIIVIKGTIADQPAGATNSLTQLGPDTTQSIIILSSGNKVPAPPLMNISDFNVGPNPSGHINFNTGEQWESKEVMFTNLTITAIVNASRGTWAITDASGNTLSMYDWSTHFTIATRTPPRDSTYIVPPVGQKIDTLRGYIGTVFGGEANRGYRIAPISPTDVKYGVTLPGVSTHRRTPVVVAKDSSPVISARAFKQSNQVNSGLKNVKLVYRVNAGAWIESTMVAKQVTVDSVFSTTIPKQNPGDYVYYFIKVTDSSSLVQRLANTGNLTQFDTSKGVFFYKVIDRSTQPILTIRDVQYTPFINGRTPYAGAVDSVGGIVTADTASLLKASRSSFGTYVYYMQSTNQPYSGVWVVGPDSTMQKVANGDSIIVKGTITEFNDVTEIFGVTSMRVVSKGNALPAPLKFKTQQFGPNVANGNLNAEPYEGMLVRFDSLSVTATDPVFNDFYQFEVSDGTSPILVALDGKSTYSTPADTVSKGTKVLRVGNKILSLTGILYYNNNRYKVIPRTNADFGTVTGISVMRTEVIPGKYVLEQNYPNPFNPATKIQYALPLSGKVSLQVYNVLGQEVVTLVNEVQSVGVYTVNFDASRLSSGMYFYRISAGNFSQVKKMMLLK